MLGKKLVSQGLIYGIASLLINGSNFFLIPFYTHYLSPNEYGIISGVTVFSTLTTAFLTFGLNGAITRFYFDFDKEEFGSFLFTVFVFQILSSLGIAAVFILFDGLFLDQLFQNVPYQPYLRYGLITGVVGTFATIPLALLQAQSKALAYRLFSTTSFLLLTAFMIALVVVLGKGSIGGVKAAFYAGSIMAVGYTVFIIRTARFSFNFPYLKMALVFGLPLTVYTIFGTLTELSSKYFIERYINLSELGIFNVAQQISAVMVLLTNAINMAWTPIFYEEAKKNEQSEVFALFGKFLIFILTSIGLVVSLFAPELIQLFVTSGYATVADYIPLLILGYILGNGYWILLISPLNFAKKTVMLPFIAIFSGLVSVGVNVALVPLMGVMGASLSMVFTYMVLIVVAYFVFRRYSKVRYDFKSMNAMVVAAILCYILSAQVHFDDVLPGLIFKVGIIAIFYFALSLLRIYSVSHIRTFIQSQFSK